VQNEKILLQVFNVKKTILLIKMKHHNLNHYQKHNIGRS